MLENDVHTLRQAYADARDETDPFEKFNRAQGMGAVRDPYPGLAAMRAQGAVHKLNLAALMGDVKLHGGQPDGRLRDLHGAQLRRRLRGAARRRALLARPATRRAWAW